MAATNQDLSELERQVRTAVEAVFDGRPGMKDPLSFDEHAGEDVSDAQGNINIKINNTVDMIMDSGSPEAIAESLANYQESAQVAVEIYDEIYAEAIEFLQDPDKVEAFAFLVENAEPTAENIARAMAGEMACLTFRGGGPVAVNGDDVDERLREADWPIDKRIARARAGAENFIKDLEDFIKDRRDRTLFERGNGALFERGKLDEQVEKELLEKEGWNRAVKTYYNPETLAKAKGTVTATFEQAATPPPVVEQVYQPAPDSPRQIHNAVL